MFCAGEPPVQGMPDHKCNLMPLGMAITKLNRDRMVLGDVMSSSLVHLTIQHPFVNSVGVPRVLLSFVQYSISTLSIPFQSGGAKFLVGFD